MQTFLPYPDFYLSVKCLDYRRLGKQRVESKQILDCLLGIGSLRWRSHPAVKMWVGHELALMKYMMICIQEWVDRGYRNTMEMYDISEGYSLPKWFGDDDLHSSHRSNLLRKDPIFYGKYGWHEPDNLPYVWPTNR